MLKPHSPEWYDRLATMQQGYYYPWRSKLPPDNGEDTYLELVLQHLSSRVDLLDVACGHGQLALDFAPHCRSVLAYDRVPSFIELAQTAARKREVDNITFLCADSSAAANDGRPRIPAEDDSFDVLISRRGPLHWIHDARRVARSGALLIQLNPTRAAPPPWNEELPEIFRFQHVAYGRRYRRVYARLLQEGLTFHSTWTFERPEFFDDVAELYRMLSWGYAPGEVPAFEQTRPALERIFARHAGPDGLAIPHGRFLWMSVVDALPEAQDEEQICYVNADEAWQERIVREFGSVAARHLHFADGFTVLALRADTPVGLISLQWRQLPPPLSEFREAYIDIIEVHPSFRRQSIGRNLVITAIKWARSSGAYQVRAWSSEEKTAAISLWRGLGFGLCPAVTYPQGEPVRGYYATKEL